MPSDLTFAQLRQASLAHLAQYAPDEAARVSGAWAYPPAVFEDQSQAPLPPQLLHLLARFPSAKLAPVLAELVRQVDRLAAAKDIDLGEAIHDRLTGKSPELPSVLKEPFPGLLMHKTT